MSLRLGGVRHVQFAAGSKQTTTVSDLPTALPIEGSAIQNHNTGLTRLQRSRRLTIDQNGHYRARTSISLVSHEFRFTFNIQALAVIDLETGMILRALSLRRHGLLVALQIKRQATLTRNVVGEVYRKTIGVVELKNDLARNRLIGNTRQRLFKDGHTVIQRASKLILLGLQGTGDGSLLLHQLWVGLSHLRQQFRHQRGKEGLLRAQLVSVADRSANDAPQHVPATLVTGQHTIGDQEGRGSQVIGNHPKRLVFGIRNAQLLRHRSNERGKQIDFIVGVHVLQHRRNAL